MHHQLDGHSAGQCSSRATAQQLFVDDALLAMTLANHLSKSHGTNVIQKCHAELKVQKGGCGGVHNQAMLWEHHPAECFLCG